MVKGLLLCFFFTMLDTIMLMVKGLLLFCLFYHVRYNYIDGKGTLTLFLSYFSQGEKSNYFLVCKFVTHDI